MTDPDCQPHVEMCPSSAQDRLFGLLHKRNRMVKDEYVHFALAFNPYPIFESRSNGALPIDSPTRE